MPRCIAVRLSKTKSRTVRLTLPLDLLDAIDEMAREAPNGPRERKNMIECSLMWAVFCHSRGRGPDAEMGLRERGYHECTLITQARRERKEVEYLESLYRLGEGV